MSVRRIGGVLAAAALSAAVAGCGGSSDGSAQDAVTSLTLTRADGSTFTVPDLVVSCGKSPGNPDGELLIKANTPDMSEDPAESRLIFYAPVAALAEGTTIDLAKQDFEDATDVVFFVLDRRTDNEVNSDTEDSTGRITVRSAGCEPDPHLDMTIDATLGSEYGDGDKVSVQGTITLGS
jgi:hypothetical protein